MTFVLSQQCPVTFLSTPASAAEGREACFTGRPEGHDTNLGGSVCYRVAVPAFHNSAVH